MSVCPALLVASLVVAAPTSTAPRRQDPPPPVAPAAAASPLFSGRAARREQFRNDKVVVAIRQGVGWLLAHQDPDGKWDADAFMKHDAADDPCRDPGNPIHDVGVTGLALLAVLAQADTLHDEACHRAADWLVRQLDKEGRVPNASFDFLYGQAIATMALAEATALLGNSRHRRGAEAAVRYLVRHRGPDVAWRYMPREPDSDASLSSWCVAALCAAFHAGIEVPAADVGAVLAWFDVVTTADGHCGYVARGEPSARKPGDHGMRFPPEKGTGNTGAGLHARLWCGTPPSDAVAQAAAQLLLVKPPSAELGAVDLYAWMHASSAMGMTGGASARRYEASLQKALLSLQQTKKSAAGSWPATDVWGEDGGRVAATALAVLALSSPYRLVRGDAFAQVPDQVPWRRLHSLLASDALGDAMNELGKLAAQGPAADAGTQQRVRWLLDVQAAHAERQLARLDKVWPSLRERRAGLEAMQARWQSHALADAAAKAVARVREDPALRREDAAEKALRPLQKAFDAWRAQPSSSRQRELRADLLAFVAKHADTEAAKQAESLLARLGGG